MRVDSRKAGGKGSASVSNEPQQRLEGAVFSDRPAARQTGRRTELMDRLLAFRYERASWPEVGPQTGNIRRVRRSARVGTGERDSSFRAIG